MLYIRQKNSERYYNKCKNRIAELDLSDNVILKTDFMEIERFRRYLHAADIIVLPYYESNESASGTANISIASKRPVLISQSAVFKEIRDICHTVKDINPSALVK